MNIIASIHDEWFQLIKSGEKTIEVRKSCPESFVFHLNKEHNDLYMIYWYNTKLKKITGRSEFIDIYNTCESPVNEKEWEEEYQGKTCMTFLEVDDYLGLSLGALLWYLGEFNPMKLELPQGKRPPQGWCYYDTIFGKE